MPIYRAPVDDYRFLFNEVFDIAAHGDLPGFGELSPDLVDDILNGAGKLCEEVLQPLNQSGDAVKAAISRMARQHAQSGFPEGLQGLLREAAGTALARWKALAATGLPNFLVLAVSEMAMSANQSLAMYPMLTQGAYGALLETGAPWMKEHVAPKMVSGEWAGTMCSTEPGCGTDLRLMKTRAVEQPDGTYRMNGTKIFISGGDQDLTGNIIHMVIAKIPDENGAIHDDLSTVNFFMVPKFLVGEDGAAGKRNTVITAASSKMRHQGPGHLRALFSTTPSPGGWGTAGARWPGENVPASPAWPACSG